MRYVVFCLMIAFQVVTRSGNSTAVSHEAEYIGFIITMAYLGWCNDRKS
ncbi:hypothetical protein NVP1191O_31 [Vibrio phage 1.191.O._10N.286.52.B4]|nr:hypothetical protein NVP1191O_31 [Vibrio phage 1.191.O._10N.286.52.B4]